MASGISDMATLLLLTCAATISAVSVTSVSVSSISKLLRSGGANRTIHDPRHARIGSPLQWRAATLRHRARARPIDRKGVGTGKSGAVRVDLRGSRIIKKKK